MVEIKTRPTLLPPTPQELDAIELLNAMMGGNLDEMIALNLLRKSDGNVEKVATALLEGDTGEGGDSGSYADMPGLEPLDGPADRPRSPPPSRPEKPVIDLTKDDDDKELARALQASLEDQSTTHFGPSDRAPDPNWAVVPSNVAATAPDAMSQDDQAMSRAIEASLSYMGEDTYQEIPLEERVRAGDTPVALRPTLSTLTYAGLIVHGLFFVPQFRQAIAQWMPMPNHDAMELSPPKTGTAYQAWSIAEILCHMDFVRMSELNVDSALNATTPEPWSTPADRPGDASFRYYEKVVYAVENVLQYNNVYNPERHRRRLMSLQYGNHDAQPDDPNTDNLSCVKVVVRSNPELNDLISSLAAELAPLDHIKLQRARQVIFEPSEVIAFQLVRDHAPPMYDAAVGRRTERATFKYPKSVYLDQFMRESYELANQKREKQRTLLAEVKELEVKKKDLLHFRDKDTLANLESCVYYYDNVAESRGDPKRAEEIQTNKEKLTRIIEKIKREAQTLESAIEANRSEALGILDCPELQHYRYDLRVVLVHDGLFGRAHLYSYVKQKGEWWKTLDYSVTKVTEEVVLNDATGLHLGAGPYFLFYSRAVSQEEEDVRADWPVNIKDFVKHHNKMFFESLPPEVREQAVDPNSPPSSPFSPPSPSEHTISSGTAEPPESESMDTSD